jgi:hypothetical protein
MSQISPPIRILLAAVVGLIAVYMLFLRPKDETVPPAAAPAASAAATPIPAEDPNATTVSKPGKIVQGAVRDTRAASDKAEQAAGTSLGINDGKTDGTTSVAPASTGVNTNPVAQAPATGQTAPPANVTKEQLASLPKDVRKAVLKRKVVAVLFYNDRSADDRAVRRELAHVNHYGGQVFVAAHWIKNVSRYQAITRGVDVEQSPTIIVADSNLKAEKLVGYVDRDTINQTVVDAIRASGGSLIKNRYYRKLDAICTSGEQQVKALQQPAAAAALPAYLAGVEGVVRDMHKKAAGVSAPAKYKRFQHAFEGYMGQSVALSAWATNHAKADGAAGVVKTLKTRGKALDKKFVKAHGAHGLSCF